MRPRVNTVAEMLELFPDRPLSRRLREHPYREGEFLPQVDDAIRCRAAVYPKSINAVYQCASKRLTSSIFCAQHQRQWIESGQRNEYLSRALCLSAQIRSRERELYDDDYDGVRQCFE